MILGVIRLFLDWLETITERQAELVIAAIFFGLPLLGVITWWLCKAIWSVSSRRYLAWREHRATLHERLGSHDHHKRIKTLWADLSKARIGIYSAIGEIGPTGDPIGEQSDETLRALQKRARKGLPAVRRAAKTFARLTHQMEVSFAAVTGFKGDASTRDRAIKLFTEDDPTTLKAKINQDLHIFKIESLSVTLFKGRRYKLDCLLDQYSESLHAIIAGSFSLRDICEMAERTSTPPTPSASHTEAPSQSQGA